MAKRLLKPATLPPGLTPEAMLKITQMIKSGRQIYGAPGASLTWGIEGSDGGDVTAGIEGEKKTANILSAWAEKHPTALVFHSIRWPGSEGDSDHIVLLGRTALIIDSKRWKSKRKYSVMANGSIKRGTVAFPEGNVKMIPAMRAWSEVLGKGVAVRGIVCISQDEVFVPYDENWRKAPFKLVTAEKLEEYLDNYVAKYLRKSDLDCVDLATAALVMARLVKPRNRRAEVINLRAARRLSSGR